MIELADRVIRLDDGRVVADRRPAPTGRAAYWARPDRRFATEDRGGLMTGSGRSGADQEQSGPGPSGESA